MVIHSPSTVAVDDIRAERCTGISIKDLPAGDDDDLLFEHRSSFLPAWQQDRTLGPAGSLGTEDEPALEPRLLPFPRGRLSFGVGVNLKMAVSRWTNWAADMGLREDTKAGSEEGCVGCTHLLMLRLAP